MNKRTRFYFDEKCLWHSGGLRALTLPVGGWVQPSAASGHAQSAESNRRIKSLMDVSGLSNIVDIRSAPMASEEDVRRVHCPEYLERFRQLSDADGGELGSYAPFGRGSYEIAKLSAGLAMAAIESVVQRDADNAYSLSRPPGHHCLPGEPMGSCLLANIPIAIEAVRVAHDIERIAVLDWDVHHGNGTQAIYYEQRDIMTISMHQAGSYPPGYSGAEDRGSDVGEGSNVNIPLPPGVGHDAYLYAINKIVIPVLNRFRPELIVIACGLDANGVDPLGRMLLHSESFRAMTSAIMETADRHCRGRLVAIHEGGYSEAYVPFCGHAVVETLAGTDMGVEDPLLESIDAQQPAANVQAFHRTLIDEMAAGLGIFSEKNI